MNRSISLLVVALIAATAGAQPKSTGFKREPLLPGTSLPSNEPISAPLEVEAKPSNRAARPPVNTPPIPASSIPSWIKKDTLEVRAAREQERSGGLQIDILMEDSARNRLQLTKLAKSSGDDFLVTLTPRGGTPSKAPIDSRNAPELLGLLEDVRSSPDFRLLPGDHQTATLAFRSMLSRRYPDAAEGISSPVFIASQQGSTRPVNDAVKSKAAKTDMSQYFPRQGITIRHYTPSSKDR
ncbi:MAG: hypothetical protein HY078_10015 [Elusimicrobia bacterium]|nr:hypothetical protein [Elusimicrobiota bacterium]